MADAEDASTQLAFQEGQQSVLEQQQPQKQRAQNEEEVPTEPATSPQNIDLAIQERPVFGVQQPPPPRAQRPDYGRPTEQYWRQGIPYVFNYGHLPQEEFQRELREARRANLDIQWDRQRREAAEQGWREHEEACQVWQDRMVAAGFMEVPKAPAGPPPVGISTETQPRALPNVHQAFRANDPKAPSSQPIISRKPPPSTGRALPKGLHRGDEPPRIGTGAVQPLPQPQLPAATPTTPAHPPRPPCSALPQPVAEFQHRLQQSTLYHNQLNRVLRTSRSARRHFQKAQMGILLFHNQHLLQLILRMWELRTPKVLQLLWCQLPSKHKQHELHHHVLEQLNHFQKHRVLSTQPRFKWSKWMTTMWKRSWSSISDRLLT